MGRSVMACIHTCINTHTHTHIQVLLPRDASLMGRSVMARIDSAEKWCVKGTILRIIPESTVLPQVSISRTNVLPAPKKLASSKTSIPSRRAKFESTEKTISETEESSNRPQERENGPKCSFSFTPESMFACAVLVAALCLLAMFALEAACLGLGLFVVHRALFNASEEEPALQTSKRKTWTASRKDWREEDKNPQEESKNSRENYRITSESEVTADEHVSGTNTNGTRHLHDGHAHNRTGGQDSATSESECCSGNGGTCCGGNGDACCNSQGNNQTQKQNHYSKGDEAGSIRNKNSECCSSNGGECCGEDDGACCDRGINGCG